ncbi:MAG TPA: hypothetical protein VLA56_10120 [Pseudomonadales bacterium]|nr:hypothetical protein [Pseudomonadales bacterium]
MKMRNFAVPPTTKARRAGGSAAVMLLTLVACGPTLVACGDGASDGSRAATEEPAATGALVTRMDAARTQIGAAEAAMKAQAEAAAREADAEASAGVRPPSG